VSAIAGIFYPTQRPVEDVHLQSMLAALKHRGGDDTGIWNDNAVGFIHHMLWTTPESLLEHLPQTQGSLTITADVRIDNRSQLIAMLGLNQQPTEKITDSDIILSAYQKWGEQCPKYLIGDFAFAIWDANNHQLLCARDPFSIKPFYYHHSPRQFVFGSEIKALLCVPGVPQRLNELMVACYLEMFVEDEEVTFYQDIYRLPAAHSLTVNANGQIKLQRYWQLDRHHQIRFKTQQEYVDAYRELFVEAVRCRLRSAFPIGSALSGGLDSSSIACTARELLNQSSSHPLHTFSAIFPAVPDQVRQHIDERYYIDAVKAIGGFTSHNIRADMLDPFTDFIWQDDEPRISSNMYIHHGLYQCAQQQGVRVFLDGIDGDGVVSHGWGHLTDLTYTGQWLKLLREVEMVSQRLNITKQKILWAYSVEPFVHQPLREFRHNLKLLFRGADRDWINLDFAKRIQYASYLNRISNQQPKAGFSSQSQHWRGFQTGIYPYAMENLDKVSALSQVEGRYPFFDRRLVEFSLAIPMAQKLNQGWTRAIHRYAMNGILPPEVQWRVNKADLAPNFRQRLAEASQPLLQTAIDQASVVAPYINQTTWQQAYQAHLENPLSSTNGMKILGASTLTLWLQKRSFI
jgi:asparagine synthase (glutamine-hydrolysing)